MHKLLSVLAVLSISTVALAEDAAPKAEHAKKGHKKGAHKGEAKPAAEAAPKAK